MVAKCTSNKCEGPASFKGVIKEVKQGTMCCPDCGSILLWIKPGRVQKHIASSGYRTNMKQQNRHERLIK